MRGRGGTDARRDKRRSERQADDKALGEERGRSKKPLLDVPGLGADHAHLAQSHLAEKQHSDVVARRQAPHAAVVRGLGTDIGKVHTLQARRGKWDGEERGSTGSTSCSAGTETAGELKHAPPGRTNLAEHVTSDGRLWGRNTQACPPRPRKSQPGARLSHLATGRPRPRTLREDTGKVRSAGPVPQQTAAESTAAQWNRGSSPQGRGAQGIKNGREGLPASGYAPVVELHEPIRLAVPLDSEDLTDAGDGRCRERSGISSLRQPAHAVHATTGQH